MLDALFADTHPMPETVRFLVYVAIILLPIGLAARVMRSAPFQGDE